MGDDKLRTRVLDWLLVVRLIDVGDPMAALVKQEEIIEMGLAAAIDCDSSVFSFFEVLFFF